MSRELPVVYQSPDVDIDEKFLRVKAELRPGGISDSLILEVRRVDDTAVVLIDRPGEDKPLGLVIDLVDTTHEFYYSDIPVASFDDWLEYLFIYVMVSLDTGLAARSERVDRGDYVQVREGA
jgi:hypothetical protein